MPFEKGKSGNPKGRPKGQNVKKAAFKSAADFKATAFKVANSGITEKQMKDWKKDDPKDFFKWVQKMVPQDHKIDMDTNISVNYAFALDNPYEKQAIDVANEVIAEKMLLEAPSEDKD